MFQRSIGVRVCLEIGDVSVTGLFAPNKCFPFFELFPNRQGRRGGKISGTPFTAEDAAPFTAGPVTVRTGTAAV